MSAEIVRFPPPKCVREAARRCVEVVEFLGLDTGEFPEERLLEAWHGMTEEERRAFLEAFSAAV